MRSSACDTVARFWARSRCFAGSHSPWPPPFAPPAPLAVGTALFVASQLLWQSLTSRDRASSATASRLPMRTGGLAERSIARLPVPAQERLAHARVSATPGRPGTCACRVRTSCLPPYATASAPRMRLFRGLMAGLCAPLSNASPNPRGSSHDSGTMWIATPSSQGNLHPLLLCRSPALRKTSPLNPRIRTCRGAAAKSTLRAKSRIDWRRAGLSPATISKRRISACRFRPADSFITPFRVSLSVRHAVSS